MKDERATEIRVDEVIPPGGASRTGGRGRFARGGAAGQPFARALAHLLDDAIQIPGTRIRIGLDPILGLLPGIGDAVAALLGVFIMGEAARRGVSRGVQARMAVNILINAAGGAVPIIGDVFSAWFKSNRRNADLLERHAPAPGRPRKTSRGTAVAMIVAIVLVIGLAFYGMAVLLGKLF